MGKVPMYTEIYHRLLFLLMGVVIFTLTTVLFFSWENTNNFSKPCEATTCSELSVLLEGLLIEKTQLSRLSGLHRGLYCPCM